MGGDSEHDQSDRATGVEVKTLRKDLDKCLEKKKEGEEAEEKERVVDILSALDRVQFTSSLIVSSKIANTINATKKTYAEDATVKGLCKQLISKWKNIYMNEGAGASSSSSSESKKDASKPKEEEKDSSVSSPAASSSLDPPPLQRVDSNRSDVEADDCEKMIALYPEGRKKIITAIAESLSLDVNNKKTTNPVAFPLACGVEAEINEMHPFLSDVKSYQVKTRKMFFSLKQNAELRQDLLDGSLTVTNLLELPSEMLATRAKREQAQKERDEIMMSKRNDYFKITRDQTMRENGLDPNAGGEHTCSKCKGQKTSSYSMQTRSADEPMTVFVTCLTCGKRWRC